MLVIPANLKEQQLEQPTNWSEKATELHGCGLKVSNYRCFGEHAEGLDCIRPINIIVGRNNSGKSTLLNSFKTAFSSNEYPEGICVSISKIITAKDMAKVSDSHVHFDNEKGVSMQRSPQRFCSNRLTGSRITIRKKGPQQHEFLSFDAPLEDLSDLDKKVFQYAGRELVKIFPPLFMGWNWTAISAERNVVPETEGGDFTPQPDGTGVTRCVETLIHRTELNRLDLIEDRIMPAMNAILGPDNIYKRIQMRRGGTTWEIYLEESKKGAVPISATGSGVKTVLQVLINLLVVPESRKQSPSDYLFAFEELENNLHPAVVRRLFFFIRDYCEKNKCHFFITTHSHIVIDLFSNDELSQILHMTHDGEFAKARTLETHSHAMDALDDLDVRASDLLQTNVVIWVEGPTDAMYIERWIDLHMAGKIRRGIDYQCVNYGGSVVKHMTFDSEMADKLIEASRICRNSIFVVDSNRSNGNSQLCKEALRVAKEVKDAGGYGWITEGREIENYLPHELIAQEAKATLSKTTKYTDVYKAIRNARGNETEMSKIVLANRVVPKLSLENMYHDDLKDRLTEICAKIARWNRKSCE